MKSVYCPICNWKQTQKPIRTWDYLKTVTVSQYKCDNCTKTFRLYQSPKSSWTIPKRKEEFNDGRNDNDEDAWKQRFGNKFDKVMLDVCKEMYGHISIRQLTRSEYLELKSKVKKRLGI
ncbi:MAG: hypothetical protein WA799_06775 [Nitrosotalea sp.]